MHFQMISHNRSLFKEGDIVLSTVQLPNGYGYESCLFTKGGSEVIGTYGSLSEAISNHVKFRRQYGLKEG